MKNAAAFRPGLSAMGKNCCIRCENAAFAYEGNTAVRDLNFTVEQGDYLLVAGENGSGKSTLLRGLLGLKTPEQGRVIREGLRENETGYLPQQGAAQKDFPASVYEVVLSGRLSLRGVRPFYSREDKRSAELNLERLGIGDIRRRCYRELSGGQQRRVLLARAFCAARKLLVLDEPAAGLDPPVTEQVYRLLNDLNRRQGITLIMVSHDVGGALNYADKILHLKGKQLFFGGAEEYRLSEPGKSFFTSQKDEPPLTGGIQ
jgi:zinc transport system ATP-binding protein